METADLDLIGTCQRDRNRLGLAAQLALLRHPGMTLAQYLQVDTGMPVSLVGLLDMARVYHSQNRAINGTPSEASDLQVGECVPRPGAPVSIDQEKAGP